MHLINMEPRESVMHSIRPGIGSGRLEFHF
jgi:hypothetical protein